MNRSVVWVSLLIFYFYPPWVFAQESLVKFPAGDAAWTVDVAYSDSTQNVAAPSIRIKKVEVIKKNDVRQNRMTWSDGHVTETWQLDSLGLQVFEYPTNHAVYVVSSNDSTMMSIIPQKFDQTLFDWLDASALKGPETYQGRNCLHYEAMVAVKLNAPGSTTPNKTLPPVKYNAWIEVGTLLPVAFDNSASLNIFSFQNAPAEPLEMPEKFQAELKRYQTALAPFKRSINGK